MTTGESMAADDPAVDAHLLLAQEGQRRLAARRLLPGTSGLPALDRLTGRAARLLGAPSVLITLLTDVQTVVAAAGVPPVFAVGTESAVSDSIVTSPAREGTALLVPDARADPHFANDPQVASGAIVAYLGVPLVSDSGDVVGALGVFGAAPRVWTANDAAVLAELSMWAITDLELAALTREYYGSRTRWDLAIAAADMGTFELDVVNEVLDWDDRLIALFGYTGRGDTEFDGTLASVERRVHPDDIGRVMSAIEEALASLDEIHVRYRIVLPDGHIRWLQARGSVVAGSDGLAERMLGVTFDVTAQQDALARTQHLLSAMPVGVIGLDADFAVTWANREAERVGRTPVAELIGRTMWELFPSTVGTIFEETYRRVAETHVAEVFEAFYPEPLEVWVEVRTVPDDEGGILVTFVDVTAQHQTQDLLRMSLDIGEALVQAPDIDSAAATLAGMSVPRLADWAIVSMLDSDRRVRDVGSAHRDPAMLAAVHRYQQRRLEHGGTGIVQQVIDTGESQLITDAMSVARQRLPTESAMDALATLAPESVGVVPLIHSGVVTGVLSLYRGAQRPAMTADELAVTSSICRRAAMTVENRRMVGALAEAADRARSVAYALQEAMLTRLPAVAGVELAARYLPAADGDRVGGDWYDAFVRPDGTLALAIGDVVGHDIYAAGVMGQLRGAMRTLAWDRDESPGALLRRADATNEGMRIGAIATVIAAHLSPADPHGGRVLRWSNAGHPPPVLVRADGSVELLEHAGKDPLLGVAPQVERADHEVRLSPGDAFVLYTDGLVERRDETIDDGLARLVDTLARSMAAGSDLDPMLDTTIAELVGRRPSDDVAMIAIRVER